MTPDDHPGSEGPTQPLPLDPDTAGAEPTEAMVAAHVPVADAATAPPDAFAPATGAASAARPRAVTWGLIAAVVLLAITVIVVLTLFVQNGPPDPGYTPAPSSSPTVTTPPTETPTTDDGETPEDEPDEPAPEPTTPPEPTEPPAPDPTETPAAATP